MGFNLSIDYLKSEVYFLKTSINDHVLLDLIIDLIITRVNLDSCLGKKRICPFGGIYMA